MGKSFRLPNGYGSIYRLSGNRRRPYAVAKTFGWDEKGKQIKKIIGYATTKKEGLEMLLEYNKNPYSNVDLVSLTFEEAFNRWMNLTKKEDSMALSNQKVYQSIYDNHCKDLYKIKISDLKTLDIQNSIDKCDKGFNTKRYIKMIASQIYKYCSVQLDMTLSKNFSTGLKIGTQEESNLHKPFEFEEINLLWKNITIDYVDTIILTIYTGMRPSELLKIELSNVFLKERYMIGGIKTEAGKNRIIPIHERIVPIIEKCLNNKKFLIEKDGKPILYRNYLDLFTNVMNQLNMNHVPHDGRHTLATELDNVGANEVCVKLILGHAIDDITKGVYTHKKTEQLVETINLAYKNIC